MQKGTTLNISRIIYTDIGEYLATLATAALSNETINHFKGLFRTLKFMAFPSGVRLLAPPLISCLKGMPCSGEGPRPSSYCCVPHHCLPGTATQFQQAHTLLKVQRDTALAGAPWPLQTTEWWGRQESDSNGWILTILIKSRITPLRLNYGPVMSPANTEYQFVFQVYWVSQINGSFVTGLMDIFIFTSLRHFRRQHLWGFTSRHT